MSVEERKWWPFPTVPASEQTDQHKREIAFHNAADRLGMRSYVFGAGNVGAESGRGRTGEVVIRGGFRYWELYLIDKNKTVYRVFVDGFENAAKGVLDWLSGKSSNEVDSWIEPFRVSRPGERGPVGGLNERTLG